MRTMTRLVAECLFLLSAVAGSHGQLLMDTAFPSATPLSLGPDMSVLYNGTLRSGASDVFVLEDNAYMRQCLGLTPTPGSPVRYIHAELWNTAALRQSLTDNSASNFDARADPMLMMANSATAPTATYQTHQSDWTWNPSDTLVDYQGYRLLRPYHHVIATINGTATNSDPWLISIANVEIWMMQQLEYTLRVSCVEEKPCPSLSFTETCSGHGQCSAGTCQCDVRPGAVHISGAVSWGDVACDTPVTHLQNDIMITGAESQGSWSFYVIQVPEGSGSLLVEMERMRGDPVLFVKHSEEGFAPGGLPAVLDYDNFADQDSFRSRLNFHYRTIRHPKAGSYYVGVYNNDVYIKEMATFTIKARWSSDRAVDVMCPAECNYRGTCRGVLSTPVCSCFSGYGGKLCEGPSIETHMGQSQMGTLMPAAWVYYRLTLDSSTHKYWKAGLVVDFNTNEAGHPVLILKLGSYPSMLENDYIFTSTQMLQGRKRFKLEATELMEGEYIFGIFNMDYYRHIDLKYQFMVSSADAGSLMPFTPYMSIVLGVTVSLFLCLFMSICKRLIQRHGLFGQPVPEQAAPFMGTGMRTDRRGVDRVVIEGFPSFPYQPPADEEGAKPDEEEMETNSEGLPSCAVCLCAYEEGEMMRRLPCNHEFHMKCIDQWLTQRTTCPMCRVALVSESQPPSSTDPTSAAEQGAQGSRTAPDSPPGSTSSDTAMGISPPVGGASSSSSASAAGPSAPIITHETEMVTVTDVSSEEAHPVRS